VRQAIDPMPQTATAASAPVAPWRTLRRDDTAVSARGVERTWTETATGWALPLALMAVGVAIHLFKLSETSIWADEAFSIQLASNSWPEFWRYVSTTEANMVLYHAILKGWLELTGAFGVPSAELVVRVPSIAFAAFSVLVVFHLGRRFWGATAGVVGAALFLLNRVELAAAREARSYTLQVLLICLSWYMLLTAITTPRHRRRWWAGYSVIMALAVYAHVFSGLVLAAQVIAFAVLLVAPTAWRGRARRSFRAMIASLAGISIAILPLVIYAATHGSSNVHIPTSSPYEVARVLWNISGHSIIFGLLLAAATAAAVLLTMRAHRRSRTSRRALPVGPAIALACWLAIPFGLAYAASQPGVNLHLFAWGYLIVVVPALCLLAAVGVASLGRPLVRGASSIALVVAAAAAMPPSTFDQPQDFRAAASWIDERYGSGDGLVCTSWSCVLAMDYYADLGHVPASLLDGSPVPWSWSGGGPRPLDLDAIGPFARDHARVFLADSLLEGDASEIKARAAAAQEWLSARYRLLDDVTIPSSLGPIRVRLYETGRSGS
jgi:mannosyltransferase